MTFVGLIASTWAGILAPVAAPAIVNTAYDPLPQYTYAYNIQDSLTGDSKSQQETREGEVVKGLCPIHSCKSFEQESLVRCVLCFFSKQSQAYYQLKSK